MLRPMYATPLFILRPNQNRCVIRYDYVVNANYGIYREKMLCVLLLLQLLANFTETLQEFFLLYEVVLVQFSLKFIVVNRSYGTLNVFLI